MEEEDFKLEEYGFYRFPEWDYYKNDVDWKGYGLKNAPNIKIVVGIFIDSVTIFPGLYRVYNQKVRLSIERKYLNYNSFFDKFSNTYFGEIEKRDIENVVKTCREIQKAINEKLKREEKHS